MTSETDSLVTSELKTVTNVKSLLESDGKIALLVSCVHLKAHNTADASIRKDDSRTFPRQSTTTTKNKKIKTALDNTSLIILNSFTGNRLAP